MRIPLLLFLLVSGAGIHAQPIQLAGILNHYTALTAFDSCLGQLTVDDTTGFRAGGVALIIQMQGATISTANNSGFGTITNLNAAGRFERVTIDSVATNTLYVRNRLLHTYDVSGKVQVVTFPEFGRAVIRDTVRAKLWNGSTGGIVAFSVLDTLVLDAPVLADGAGFRGGGPFVAADNNCTWLIGESDYYYGFGTWRGSYKGEGIAAAAPDKPFGRGPQANGGGGGNDHNAGGGGGANAGAGGRGGDNDEPSTFGCDGYFPGLGGRAPATDTTRLFAGGGGGAGHANNNLTSFGGNGGGIIVLEAGTIHGTHRWISANGQSGGTANGDGGGGGGAGGTIWLYVRSAPENLTVQANGGVGGNTINNNQDRCFGPGGGGGGGRILTNITGLAVPTGQMPGIVTGTANSCGGSSNGAESGMPGVILALPAILPGGTVSAGLPQILTEPVAVNACAGQPVSFSVEANPGNWHYQWEVNTGAGWLPVDNGPGISGAQSPVLQIAAAMTAATYHCQVQRPGCGGVSSAEATLNVAPAPVAAFSATIDGATVFFENQSLGASVWWWDFGDGTFDTGASPQHTYTAEGAFVVSLYAISACDTSVQQQTIHILLTPTALFSAPDSVIDCETLHVTFSNQSSANADAFFWTIPGGIPGFSVDINPTVSFAVSGVYPVTLVAVNAAGADTFVREIVVQVLGFPQAGFSYTVFGGNQVQFSNTSQNASNYTWYFGDDTDPVYTQDALHQYAQSGTYTVTLVVDNYCGSSVLQQTIEIMLTGAGAVFSERALRVYPNPAGDWLLVECLDGTDRVVDLEIVDMTGRRMWKNVQMPGELQPIPLESFMPGVYRLIARFENGVLYQSSFVKQ